MKRRILKMLFNKRQRAIIWQAILFSEHTYRRRGNVNAAATVQTVINETGKMFGFDKAMYSKEEVDEIVAGVVNDSKAQVEDAFKKGTLLAEEKIKLAYNHGFNHCLEEIKNTSISVLCKKIDLSGCKDKKEALEKALSAIINEMEFEDKSDNENEDKSSDNPEDNGDNK